jgi:hypothetical protein
MTYVTSRRTQGTATNRYSDSQEGTRVIERNVLILLHKRKATPMTTSQQTILQGDQARATEPKKQAEGVATVQDAARSESDVPAMWRNGSKSGTPRPTPFAYPAWPTSKPGPQATPPLPGQHPHPLRTDQMVYSCYDQERGRPCVPPPGLPPVRESRKRTYLPDTDFLEVVSEKEALQRWLDDGGSSNHEVVSQKGGSRGGSIPLREEDVSSSSSKG